VHPDNVTRPILADPSEERVLYERMGSLAIYRDGVLYLAAPALPIVDTSGEIPPIPPTPESIWWVTNFDTSGVTLSIFNNNIILNSTNEINNNYMTRLFSYIEPASYFYNRDGTLLKDLNASTRTANVARYVDSLLTFTSKDGKSMNLLHFRGGYTGFFNSRTFNFTLASITPRIATTSSRTYSALFYNAFSDTPASTPLQILDISDNIVAQINTDVSGSSSARCDTALIITDENGNYITNASMRTTDLSDNNTGNSIVVRGINTFSDGSVIVAGDFSTQQIVFYNAADVSMEQLTIPVRKTSGAGNNRDIFMAAFNTSGVLRYYNYIRSTSIGTTANEIDSALAIDSNDNAYLVGTFINPSSPNLIQIFDKNTSSTTPSSNILYDTSGYKVNNIPNDNCNFASAMCFITKYDYSGNFQWFAPMGTNLSDLSGDVSYHVKTTNTGVVLSTIFNGIVQPGNALKLYQGKTIAQRDTSGVIFRNVDLSNTTLGNVLIAKYDSSGNGAWVRQIRGNFFPGSPTLTNISHPIPLVVDNSSNIYSVSSFLGTGSFPTVQLFNILDPTAVNTQLGGNVGPSSGSNPYIVSLTDSGSLRWYGLMNNESAAFSGTGVFCYNSATTTNNELVLLANQFSKNRFDIYNTSGSLIKQTIADISNVAQPHLAIYKIASDGTNPGTTVKYIISRPTQVTSTFNMRVNNGLTVDSSNNVYVTGELNSTSPAIGQTMDLINQDGNTVATVTKRSIHQYEYFTVKIPASFTQE
jgi:hypothetical protein